MYLGGMWNEEFVRANVEALVEAIGAYEPDVIVDFWNPFACIAARASHKPLITVIQSDMHPQSQGFIWWKKPPSELHPSPIPATNRILAEYHLPPIGRMGELLIGDMTLVLGLPETDPLPETADVTYIGPILWQKQGKKLPAWIDDLGREQPVIWLYPGNLQYMRGSSTFGDSAVVLQACIDLIIPTYSERESNARRIAAQGAGGYVVPESDITGKRKQASAEEVRAKVFNILSDASFSENAKRISEKMKAYGGASETARLIEDFCQVQ
jgi:hypothetical protein